MLGGDGAAPARRKPEIMADAAHVILTRASRAVQRATSASTRRCCARWARRTFRGIVRRACPKTSCCPICFCDLLLVWSRSCTIASDAQGGWISVTTLETLAHELRQPLSAILSNAQAAQRLLAGGGRTAGEVREILEDIVACDKRAAALLRNLEEVLRAGEPLESSALRQAQGEQA